MSQTSLHFNLYQPSKTALYPKKCKVCHKYMEMKQINLTEAVRMCFNCSTPLHCLDLCDVEFYQRSYRTLEGSPQEWVSNIKTEEEELKNLQSWIEEMNLSVSKYEDCDEDTGQDTADTFHEMPSNMNGIESGAKYFEGGDPYDDWEKAAMNELDAAMKEGSNGNSGPDTVPFSFDDLLLPEFTSQDNCIESDDICTQTEVTHSIDLSQRNTLEETCPRSVNLSMEERPDNESSVAQTDGNHLSSNVIDILAFPLEPDIPTQGRTELLPHIAAENQKSIVHSTLQGATCIPEENKSNVNILDIEGNGQILKEGDTPPVSFNKSTAKLSNPSGKYIAVEPPASDYDDLGTQNGEDHEQVSRNQALISSPNGINHSIYHSNAASDCSTENHQEPCTLGTQQLNEVHSSEGVVGTSITQFPQDGHDKGLNYFVKRRLASPKSFRMEHKGASGLPSSVCDTSKEFECTCNEELLQLPPSNDAHIIDVELPPILTLHGDSKCSFRSTFALDKVIFSPNFQFREVCQTSDQHRIKSKSSTSPGISPKIKANENTAIPSDIDCRSAILVTVPADADITSDMLQYSSLELPIVFDIVQSQAENLEFPAFCEAKQGLHSDKANISVSERNEFEGMMINAEHTSMATGSEEQEMLSSQHSLTPFHCVNPDLESEGQTSSLTSGLALCQSNENQDRSIISSSSKEAMEYLVSDKVILNRDTESSGSYSESQTGRFKQSTSIYTPCGSSSVGIRNTSPQEKVTPSLSLKNPHVRFQSATDDDEELKGFRGAKFQLGSKKMSAHQTTKLDSEPHIINLLHAVQRNVNMSGDTMVKKVRKKRIVVS